MIKVVGPEKISRGYSSSTDNAIRELTKEGFEVIDVKIEMKSEEVRIAPGHTKEYIMPQENSIAAGMYFYAIITYENKKE